MEKNIITCLSLVSSPPSFDVSAMSKLFSQNFTCFTFTFNRIKGRSLAFVCQTEC